MENGDGKSMRNFYMMQSIEMAEDGVEDDWIRLWNDEHQLQANGAGASKTYAQRLITYTSDYFQELYDLAVELIRRGHAYVHHQTPEEIKEYREKKMNSPYRDMPILEPLKLFNDMRCGMIEEGKATLRMKLIQDQGDPISR